MDQPIRKFPNNTRVKLRDGVHPGFYRGLGLPGNEGWIRDHDTEQYGYHRAYIEWDKNHWAYNGAPDGWTWEEHFEKVEDSMSDKKHEIIEKLVEVLGPLLEEDKEEERSGEEISEITGEKSKYSYDETLEKAFEAASDAEAFMLITVNKGEETSLGTILRPEAFHASHNTEASLLCQLQLTYLSTAFTEAMAKEKLYDD